MFAPCLNSTKLLSVVPKSSYLNTRKYNYFTKLLETSKDS